MARSVQMSLTTIPAWSTVPSIAYRLTDDEVRAAFENGATKSAASRPMMYAVAGVQFFNGILHIGQPTVADRALGACFLFIGSLSTAVAWFGQRRWSGRSQREVALSFDESGIHCSPPLPALIPWQAVAEVYDRETILLFTRSARPSIVVPKRVFADRGQALWAILVDRLIAKGSLRRRADSHVIVNTAIRPGGAP